MKLVVCLGRIKKQRRVVLLTLNFLLLLWETEQQPQRTLGPRVLRGGQVQSKRRTLQHRDGGAELATGALMKINAEKDLSKGMQTNPALPAYPLGVTASCLNPHSLWLWRWEIVQVGLLGVLSRWAYSLWSSESPYKQRKPENLKPERCDARLLAWRWKAGKKGEWFLAERDPWWAASKNTWDLVLQLQRWVLLITWMAWEAHFSPSYTIPDKYSAPDSTLISAYDTLNRGTLSQCQNYDLQKHEGAGKHISPELPNEHSDEHRNWPLKNGVDWNIFRYTWNIKLNSLPDQLLCYRLLKPCVSIFVLFKAYLSIIPAEYL